MTPYRPLEFATAALGTWYFAANLSEEGKPWHAGPYPYPGPYRVFVISADDSPDDRPAERVAYFADSSASVVIAGHTVPTAVLAAATRLPLGLGCYLGPSGELCNGLGRPALVPAGSEVCPHCRGNRCVPEESVGSVERRWTFCERCGGHGWVEKAEPHYGPANCSENPD
jgi:hypothetical protein